MLYGTTSFDRSLANWDISGVTDFRDFMKNGGISTINYDETLISWASQDVSLNQSVDFGSSKYSYEAAAAKQTLIDTYGWTITDGGLAESPEFVISVKTDNLGNSNDNQFTLPWTGTYDIDWGDGVVETGLVNAKTHTYPSSGTYDVKVTAATGKICFNDGGDKEKLLDIKNWGNCQWTDMHRAFKGCYNLAAFSCADVPNFEICTSTNEMFRAASKFSGNSSMNSWNMSNINNTAGMFSNTPFNSPIGNWDVSNVTTLSSRYSGMFQNSSFNQDISSWDVSNVTNMTDLFGNSPFNQPINDWDVSSVIYFGTGGNVNGTFGQDFNQPLDKWDVSNVTHMRGMFYNAKSFNQDISSWDVSNVIDMSVLFGSCTSFNQDISSWDVSSVTTMAGNHQGGMFSNCKAFDQDLSSWDTSNVTNMGSMFSGCDHLNSFSFLEFWDVSNVRSFNAMFRGCSQLTSLPIDNWNVSSVTDSGTMFMDCTNLKELNLASWDMSSLTTSAAMFQACYRLTTIGPAIWNLSNVNNMWRMFSGCRELEMDLSQWTISSSLTNMGDTFADCYKFNSDISNWDVSNVNRMDRTFMSAKIFNTDISGWDTSSVNTMDHMFHGALKFNQPINSWDVSNVTNMRKMFTIAKEFNQPISTWNTSSVTTMEQMFNGAYKFNQSLGNLNIENVSDVRSLLSSTFMSSSNYDATLAGWATQTLRSNEQVDFGYANYSSAGLESKNLIINNFGWTITDGGLSVEFDNLPVDSFVFSVQTDSDYTVPTLDTHSYNYNIETSDGQVFTGMTGDTTITFPSQGIYEISITGDFSRPYFYNYNYDNKFRAVKQWSSTPLTSLNLAFSRCRYFYNDAINAPNLSICTDMGSTFALAQYDRTYSNFGKTIGNWDVSNITNMNRTFSPYCGIDDNLGDWDVSSVTDMSHMFNESSNFENGGVDSLNNWNVSNVTDFENIFRRTARLDQYIGDWEFNVPTSFTAMFNAVSKFSASWGIDKWNTTNVTSMRDMFQYSAGNSNQDLSGWDIRNVTSMTNLMSNAHGLDITNYEKTLVSWAAQVPQTNISVNFSRSKYLAGSPGEIARQELINTYNWTISDGGIADDEITIPFIFTIDTVFPGTSETNQFTLPWSIDGYYTATISDGQVISNTSGGDVITFASSGTYQVSITGVFPSMNTTSFGDQAKITEINQWGDNKWTSMYRMFNNCTNLSINALDFPITENVTSMAETFRNCKNIKSFDFLSSLDVSNVTTMSHMFNGSSLNGEIDLSKWDVSSLTNVDGMFGGNDESRLHKINLSNWNAPNLTSIRNMFGYNNAITELDITNWNVPNIVSMRETFKGCRVNFTSIIGIEYLDTSNVTDMYRFLYDADNFDQSLESFNMQNVTELRDILAGTVPGISTSNYDSTLISWANQVVRPNEHASFGSAKYTLGGEAEEARNTLINTYGWTITDGGGI